MQFCIIGTGRSGTSMLARMLNICGVYLGDPAEMLAANKSNELGYWEHVRINQFVLELIAYLRSKHGRLAPIANGWQDDPGLDPFYERARALFDEIFGDRPLCCFKYGYATLIIPFWKKLLPDLRFIICARNPADYASSLEKMFGNDRWFGYNAWLFSNLISLNDTTPEERAICFYERFFPHYENGLFPMLDFLGIEHPKPGSAEDVAIREFYRPDLRHHAATMEDLDGDPDSHYWVGQLYRELLAGGIHADRIDMLSKPHLYMPLLEHVIRLAEEKGIATEQKRVLAQQLEGEQAKLAETQSNLAETQSNLAEARSNYAEAKNNYANAQNRVEWLESVLSSRTHRIASRVCDVLAKVHSGRQGAGA